MCGPIRGQTEQVDGKNHERRKMNGLVKCRAQEASPRYKWERDVEADARIAAEGIDPESDEEDEITTAGG